jgi:hypothetical protein
MTAAGLLDKLLDVHRVTLRKALKKPAARSN